MNKKRVLSKLNPLFLSGIAHRGYLNDKYTENGMNAFKDALNRGVPIELDVHLTTDNDLVICHDEDLFRTTGKHGIIEDMSVKEIKENYRLLDGGEVPTFEEVLDLVDEKVPLVVELKVFRKNYKPLSKKVIEVMQRRVRDKKNYMLISFDPRSLWPLKKLGIIRSLLVAESHLYVYNLFRHTVESVDLEHVLLKRKNIQRYHKRYLVNVWTIENEELMNEVLPYVDTMTFQLMDENIIRETLNNKR